MKSAFVLAAMLAAAGTAMADGTVRMTAPYGNDGFRADVQTGWLGVTDANGEFDSFCIELNEYFTPGTTYYGVISTFANNGGQGGGPLDPLSERTAKMYAEFRNGGDFGGAGKVQDTPGGRAALQAAIWASEQELSVGSLNALATQYYNFGATAVAGNFYNVRVMQLWGDPGRTQYVQDQLTLVPLPPAAFAGMGSLACVLGAGFIRRRAQRA